MGCKTIKQLANCTCPPVTNFNLLNALLLNYCSEEILFIVPTTHAPSCILELYALTTHLPQIQFSVLEISITQILTEVYPLVLIYELMLNLSCTLNCNSCLLQMVHQTTRGLNCFNLVLVYLCVIEPIVAVTIQLLISRSFFHICPLSLDFHILTLQ